MRASVEESSVRDIPRFSVAAPRYSVAESPRQRRGRDKRDNEIRDAKKRPNLEGRLRRERTPREVADGTDTLDAISPEHRESEIRRQVAEDLLESERRRFEEMREELDLSRAECLRKLELLEKWAAEVETNNNRVADEMKRTVEVQRSRVVEMEKTLTDVCSQRDRLLNLVEKYGVKNNRRMTLLIRALGVLHIFGGLAIYPALRSATMDLLWPPNFHFTGARSLLEFARAPFFAYLYKAVSWAKEVPLAPPAVIETSVSRLRDQRWAVWYHAFGLYLLSPKWACAFGAVLFPFHLPMWAGLGAASVK